MSQVQHNGKTFSISPEIQSKYHELIDLILNTDSMDDDERQYWFDIMPSMTESQIDRLFNILDTEKKKLAELEIKYQKEIKTLNEKHLIEWQEFQVKQNKQKVAQAHQDEKSEETNTGDPDDVLKLLNNI
jgi:hypothetical protein